MPSSGDPAASVAPAVKSRASARRRLPDAPCPARATFRISAMWYDVVMSAPKESCGRGPRYGFARAIASLSSNRPSYKVRPTMQPATGKSESRSKSASELTPPEAMTAFATPARALRSWSRSDLRACRQRDVGVHQSGEGKIVEGRGQRRGFDARNVKPTRRRHAPVLRRPDPRRACPDNARHRPEPGRILQGLRADDHAFEAGVEPDAIVASLSHAAAQLARYGHPVRIARTASTLTGRPCFAPVEVDRGESVSPPPPPTSRPSRRDHRRRPSPGRNLLGGDGRSSLPEGQ